VRWQHCIDEWQTTRPTDNSAQDNSAQAELSRDNSAPVWDNSARFQRQLGPDGFSVKIIFIGEIERWIHIVCEEYYYGGY